MLLRNQLFVNFYIGAHTYISFILDTWSIYKLALRNKSSERHALQDIYFHEYCRQCRAELRVKITNMSSPSSLTYAM